MDATFSNDAASRRLDPGRVRRIVGIADMAVSTQPCELLVTYALGSCLGLSVFDPVAGVGGLLHFMLPQASLAPERAAGNPFVFADTGVPRLFLDSYALGAKKERMVVVVAGGASFNQTQETELAIGQRNIAMLRKVLWKNGVLLKRQDVGGSEPRGMTLDVGTGTVSIGFGGVTRVLYEGNGI